MDAGGPRCVQDFLGSRLRIEARDICGDAALEEPYVLRQVADMLAESSGRPMLERSVVELDPAAKPRPNPNQRPHQGRFARSAGTNDPDSLPLRNWNETSLRIGLSAFGGVT
jgi:hypothetical protein